MPQIVERLFGRNAPSIDARNDAIERLRPTPFGRRRIDSRAGIVDKRLESRRIEEYLLGLGAAFFGEKNGTIAQCAIDALRVARRIATQCQYPQMTRIVTQLLRWVFDSEFAEIAELRTVIG